jgi:hypothetical protein
MIYYLTECKFASGAWLRVIRQVSRTYINCISGNNPSLTLKKNYYDGQTRNTTDND